MSDGRMISVIVPVYNIEQYIRPCVFSLINQSYREIEIILVDDGSTDSSGEICDDLATEDERIIVYHKLNGGLSDARNYGLKKANGEFISFIDGDDYLDTKAYETIAKELNENVDIVVFSIELNYADGKIKRKSIAKKEVFSNVEGIIALNSFKGIDVSACNKVFRASLFDSISFPVGKYCEDFYIMYRLFDSARTIVAIPDVLYHYRQRAGSITKSSSFNMDYLYASKTQLDYIAEKYPDLKTVAETNYGFSYLTKLNYCIKLNQIDDFGELIKSIKQFEKQVEGNAYIPAIKRIQYRLACRAPHVYRLLIKYVL